MKVYFFISLFVLGLLGCKAPEEQTLSAYDNLPGDIFISIAHPFDLEKDDWELLVSVPKDTDSVKLCLVDPDTEICGEQYGSTKIYSKGERDFFKFQDSMYFEHGEIVAFFTLNTNGDVVDMRTVSQHNNEDPSEGSGGAKKTTEADSSVSGDAASSETSANPALVENNNCAVAGCHNSPSYDTYSASQKHDALSSGRMPRGRTISTADKEVLLKYFQGN